MVMSFTDKVLTRISRIRLLYLDKKYNTQKGGQLISLLFVRDYTLLGQHRLMTCMSGKPS